MPRRARYAGLTIGDILIFAGARAPAPHVRTGRLEPSIGGDQGAKSSGLS